MDDGAWHSISLIFGEMQGFFTGERKKSWLSCPEEDPPRSYYIIVIIVRDWATTVARSASKAPAGAAEPRFRNRVRTAI